MTAIRLVPGGVEHDPTGGGAPAPHCDDHGCCAASAQVPGTCTAGPPARCVGLGVLGPNSTPKRSRTHVLHSLGIDFCASCKRHERGHKHQRIDLRMVTGQIWPQASQQNAPPPGGPPVSWGARADLCNTCIDEEMKLYWERVNMQNMPGTGLPFPTDPASIPTLQWIEDWPTVGAPAQDLCICHERTVARFQRPCCHACRDKAFYSEYLSEAIATEDVLRERRKIVIRGKRLCDINGGDSHFYEDNTEIAARAARNVGRMCPCGNEPVPAAPAAHFIDVCLTCSGVRVDSTNIPPAKQQLAMFPPNRRVTRNHATKGARKVRRGPEYRVNIELAWRSADPGDEDPWIADR